MQTDTHPTGTAGPPPELPTPAEENAFLAYAARIATKIQAELAARASDPFTADPFPF
jgi:hypothetical protein